ncbi:winged helix-turn-helix transcriptional regulator [Thermococcus sp. Bubb.Bath]|uniref:winged helix-turn-helix transcriptional regulator n=1 Tax=Thermococcus sp. Bubb.Bath TaxID=1638242 RepID=UPI00143A2A5A|nr:winged helix-turn-helix transcriptional regulator [Thermococcus sp. Bubb.Bath]NJF24668.1 winged helix-turn-helix transcriptional regulator [Thermococcus sp. Bubb.Bath]
MGSDELNERTKLILNFIRENPGLSFNEISRQLGLAKGDLQYHIQKLKKLGLITSKRSGLRKHYFPKGIFNEREKDVLSLLSSENVRGMIMYIIANPGATQKELCSELGLSPPTVNYYIAKLDELGLVRSIKDGKFVKYYFKGDVELFIKMIQNYHPSLFERWADRIVDIFMDFEEGV